MNRAPKLIQKKQSIWLITTALIVSEAQMRPSLGALVGIIIQAALLFSARYFAMMEKEDWSDADVPLPEVWFPCPCYSGASGTGAAGHPFWCALYLGGGRPLLRLPPRG